MNNDVQEYLNMVGWSTITVLAEKFEITRSDTLTLLYQWKRKGLDVRIYDDEIVHV